MTVDQITVRAADAAVPDPPSGSGTAAVPRSGSRRWADARVVPLDPAAVATAWVTALARGDWTTAWSTTDANLRLAVAQQWLDRLGRAGDNVSAWSLAAEVPHVGMWAPFAHQLFDGWSRALVGASPCHRRDEVVRVHGPLDPHRFGTAIVVATGDGPAPDLTLRLRDRWRVAGVGRGVMQPGWPARWVDLAEVTDAP